MTKRVWSVLFFVCTSSIALAGPPYVTDDPEPTDTYHYELNIAAQYSHDAGGSAAALPRAELNYGPAENVQIGIAAPLVLDDPEHGKSHFGLGDVELSAKYRFITETPTRPMVAFFPSIALPTGNVNKNLGAGRLQLFLPLWLQKSWDDDKWTTFGGGGWIHNPAAQDFWRFGWALQRQLTDRLAIGGELFYETADANDAKDHLGFNLAAIYDVNEHFHIMLSAGRDIVGENRFSSYTGIQLTW